MRVRYMTQATDRPRIVYEIHKRVVTAFQQSEGVEFAVPYIYSSKKGSAVGGALAPLIAQHDTPRELEVKVIELPPDENVFNPSDDARIEELKRTIKERGLPHPIVVQDTGYGRFRVLAGRLDFEACRRLGWERIPVCVVRSESSEKLC